MAQRAARRLHILALLAAILLAFALRIFQLAGQELRFDEALSAVIAGKSWAGIIAHTQASAFEHPPLYYLALRAWSLAAGSGEFALRFFSLFWSVLLIPLLYRFLASWGGRRFALLAALVTALSYTFIDHAQNVRMYALLPFLAVAALYCFFLALQGNRARWWVAHAALMLAGIAVHFYFSVLLLVPIVLLLLGGRRYRRQLAIYGAILVATGIVFLGWVWLSPGPRGAVLQILRREGVGVSSLGQRLRFTAGYLFLEPPAIGHLALGLLAIGGAVFWPLRLPPRRHPLRAIGSRAFLLVWLLVPWLAALAVPYWLQARHLIALWPALYALVACGLLVLRRWGKAFYAAGLLLLFATTGYALFVAPTSQEPQFEYGRIMAYIEERAQADDLLVMTQPQSWMFHDYYNRRGLDYVYVPDVGQVVSYSLARERLTPLIQDRSRVWLGPIGAWTGDPTSLVERWLSHNTYPASKQWFPGSGSASLFVVGETPAALPIERGAEWQDGVQLLDAFTTSEDGPPDLAPGDSLLLSLIWRATGPMDDSYLVSLTLEDASGRVWAQRQSEPCGGACPTTIWQPSAHQQDNHALQIPAGTPPGLYHLRLGLYSPTEGRELDMGGGGSRLELGDVQILRPGGAGVAAAPVPEFANTLRAQFGDVIVLRSYRVEPGEVPAGGQLAVDLHWAAATQPANGHTLRLELAGPTGSAATWERHLVSEFAPTGGWLPGDEYRARHEVSLPSQLAAGSYDLRLSVLNEAGEPQPISGWRPRSGLGRLAGARASLRGDALDLGSLRVEERPDRERSFDLPEIANPLEVTLGREVELLGYKTAPLQAVPGATVELTLYWRGKGPTDLPYSVFTHLGDGSGPPVAQHDGSPGGGCCPTDTWAEGEVVVDVHPITLPPDVLPGVYRLTAGMYDPATGLRLPARDAQGAELEGQQVVITEVLVEAPSAPEPTAVPAASLEMDFRIFLPHVAVSW